MNYVLDTHILVWRLLDPKKLSSKIQKIFKNQNNYFYIPTISVLEIQYLNEINRIHVEMDEILRIISEDDQYKTVSYDQHTMLQSLKLTSTRDPFDRIILGHAIALATKIITHDRWMKREAPKLVIN